MNENPIPASPGRPNLRPIALPVEHGGWGFLLEPILLGLLVAPSMAGLWLGLAAVALFLLHQPLRIALKDRLKGRRYARTGWAEGFALGYGALAVLAFGLALWAASEPFWPPLALAAPLVAVKVGYDALNRGREHLPEIAGALAPLAVSAGIALAGGWALPNALALWGILAARTMPAILYVRARLRLEKGESVQPTPAVLAHLGGLIALALLSLGDLSPWSGAAMLVVLLARALYGLSRWRRPAPAKVIGFQEIGYGLLNVAALALGFRLGW